MREKKRRKKTKNKAPRVIGLILTYNCAHLLKGTYERLPRNIFDNIIVSDDGSRDNVKDVARKLNLPFFCHEHSGYGGNLRFGLKKALQLKADYVVEIHGDGQFDQSVTPKAIKLILAHNFDFLIGSRFTELSQPLKDGMPLPRYLANIGLSFMERMVLGIPWTEFHPGYRVYGRDFLSKLNLDKGKNDYVYSLEIIALAAYHKARCGEIPARANYHKAHTSVNYKTAAKNSLQEIGILIQYILAKRGFKTGIFT